MRVFLGILLGIFITIAATYVYDSTAAGPVTTTTQVPTGEVRKPMVNWDVVSNDWHTFKAGVRHAWDRLAARG
jgi:hypothetical protein